MPCWQRVVKKKEEGEEKEGGVDKTLPSGSVDKTQASSSSQKQKREASVDKTEASSSQQLKREASVDKTQASGIAVKAMVADYEEKHIAPPKLKRGCRANDTSSGCLGGAKTEAPGKTPAAERS